MARIRIIAQDRYIALIICVNKIEVAVAVQVTERRAKAHAFLVESPRRAHIFETQIAQIAESQMTF